jgi:hypothetical protein
MPRICGTAMLSIERMRKLEATVTHAALDAVTSPDGIRVTFSAADVEGGLPLPAHVGIALVPAEASASYARPTFHEVHAGVPITLVTERYAPGQTLLVRFQHADAFRERAITVR